MITNALVSGSEKLEVQPALLAMINDFVTRLYPYYPIVNVISFFFTIFRTQADVKSR